jgi:Protein of unknown function (DUF2514)
MSILDPRVWLAFALTVAAAFGAGYWRGDVSGKAEVQGRWDAERNVLKDAALAEAAANAKETQRRLDRQQENQLAQDRKLAVARADAERNAAAADSLRDQNAAAAREWSAALSDSPTPGECAAAGAAIGVLTDLLGRADRRAGVLASHADSARAAGLKCEADYDSLRLPQ